MLKINKELSEKIIKLEKVHSYISVVVDYKKEEEFSNLQNEITSDVENTFANNFENYTNNDIAALINAIDQPIEYFLYSSDDIIETLFPAHNYYSADVKKNHYIQSAYNWIEEKKRIDWIINNVLEVPSSKKFYGNIENINDNYILSTMELNNLSYKEA